MAPPGPRCSIVASRWEGCGAGCEFSWGMLGLTPLALLSLTARDLGYAVPPPPRGVTLKAGVEAQSHSLATAPQKHKHHLCSTTAFNL